ncbi:hypothetical protein F5B21DRAFT_498679 [Xylaria acuta]|nr:hypothetical protein F5B21DRAFT_498679 [Xylaria acuta]
MFAFKTCLLAFLVFVTTALAGRVSFTAKYPGGLGGQPQRTPIAEQYDDDKTQSILDNMNTWSDGLYSAKKNERTGIVIVTDSDTAKVYPSKNDAITAVQAMISTVSEHYQGPSQGNVISVEGRTMKAFSA